MKKNNQEKNRLIKVFLTIFIILIIGLISVRHPRGGGDLVALSQDPRLRGDDNSVDIRKNDVSKVSSDSPIIKTEKIEELSNKVADTQNILNFQLIIDNQKQNVSIPKDSTLYEVFKILKSDNNLIFEGQNYPGLGFFVTRIGSMANGEGGNLMYYINGVEASQGVSSYIVKEGDIIEWKLK